MILRAGCVVVVTAIVLLLLVSPATAAPRLDRYTFCHAVGSASSNFPPIRESKTYYTTDDRVYVWMKFSNWSGAHAFHALWIDPEMFDSVLSTQQTPQGSWDSYYIWFSIDFPPGPLVGRWRVLVYMDGKLIIDDSFQRGPGWLQEIEPNNLADTAEPIGFNDQISGTTSLLDPDWFKVTINRAGQYYIEAGRYWSYYEPILSVYSAADLKNPLAHLDDRENTGAGTKPGELWAECVLVTRPGTYYVRVWGSSSLDYVLSIKETMPWWVKR